MTEPRPLTDEERDIIAKSRRAFDGMLSVENVSRLMASERFYLERFAESDPLKWKGAGHYECEYCKTVNGYLYRSKQNAKHAETCDWRIAVETVARLEGK